MKKNKEDILYPIDTVKSIMKYFFMIDEKDILPQPNAEKGEQCSYVNKILWDSMWQCENYAIKREFFGAEPTNGSWEKQDLVTKQETTFEFVSRKIILDNVTYDIYHDLVRKSDKDYIQKGIKYMTWGRQYGYHELKKRNLLDSDFNKNIPDTALASKSNLEQGTRDRIRSCKQTNYYKKIVSDLPNDQSEAYLISDKQKKLPIFDAQFLSELIASRVCECMDNLHNAEESDKQKKNIDKLNREMISLCVNKRDFVIDKNRKAKLYEKEKVLDNNCCLYTIERVFRCNMIRSVNEVLKFLQDQGIRQSSIESALLQCVTSSLAFGGDYLIKYPLKYIYNNNFIWNNKEEDLTRNSDKAENTWVNRYIKYLNWLIRVELPIVRNNVFCNLWSNAHTIVDQEKEVYSNTDIIKQMIDLLNTHLEENLGCVAADYSVFLDWQGQPFSNLRYEEMYPNNAKELYASMTWKNSKLYTIKTKDKPIENLENTYITERKWQNLLAEIYKGSGKSSPFEMALYNEDTLFGNPNNKEWRRKIAEIQRNQLIRDC